MVKTQDGGVETTTRRTVASACILMFLISLDVTIINVALPTIQHALTVPAESLSWAVVSYTLPFATLMLSGGVLSDRYGAARVFISGIVIFAIGSLIDATAPNFLLLSLGRAVQGVGAALCMPSTLAVLRSSVPPQRLGRTIAWWTFSGSVAISVGPIMSGALVQFWTWRSIFLINIVIAALAVYLILPEVLTSRQKSPAAPSRMVDFIGQAFYVVFSSLLIGGLIFVGDEARGFRWELPVALFALSIGCLVAFLVCERRAANPVVPAALLTNKVFQSAVIVGGSISLVNFGLVYCLGLYYGGSHGSSALTSGILFLPMMVACGLATSCVERVRRAIGDRMTVTAGLGAQLVGSIFICLQPDNIGWVSGNAAFLGFGVGLALPPVTAGLLAAVDAKNSGVASGAFSSIRQFASAIGVAALGLLVQGTNKSVHVDLRSASVICAAVLVIALATYLVASRLRAKVPQQDAAR